MPTNDRRFWDSVYALKAYTDSKIIQVLEAGQLDRDVICEVISNEVPLSKSYFAAIKRGYPDLTSELSAKLDELIEQSDDWYEDDFENDDFDWDAEDDDEEDDPYLIEYQELMAREEAEFVERWSDFADQDEDLDEDYDLGGCDCENCQRVARGEPPEYQDGFDRECHESPFVSDDF